MDPSYWAVILLLVSMILLFAEIFIPSGGIIFILSMSCLIGAVWSAWDAWWETSPVLWWLFLVSVLILLPSSLGAAIYLWPYTPIGRRAEPPTEDDVTPQSEEQRRLEKLVGDLGETVTPLNPAGLIRAGGLRIHAYSEGMIVPKGEPVRILKVHGNRVLVRQVSWEEKRASQLPALDEPPGPADDAPREPPPLDFDVPAD